MRLCFQALALLFTAVLIGVPAQTEKPKKRKKSDPEYTEVLELPKDPPLALSAETARLSFHVVPLSAKGLLSQQVRDGARALLRQTRGAAIVRVRAFVAGTGDMRRVQAVLSEEFSVRRLPLPVLTVVQVGSLPLEGAQVSMEAVASEKKPVNPEGLAFYSGQLRNGPDPLGPPQPLLEESLSLLKKLLDATPGAEMVSTTCFLHSLQDAAELRATVAKVFPQAAVLLAQSIRGPNRGLCECEGVARLAKAPEQTVSFPSLAGSPPSPDYSPVAWVRAPKLVFTGLQLGFRPTEDDVRLAFQRLGKALESAKTDYKQVVASRTYVLNPEAATLVRKLKFDYYSRPAMPASTMLLFEGLPSLDATFGLDLIAVAKE